MSQVPIDVIPMEAPPPGASAATADSSGNDRPFVRINVGGVNHTTSRTTLLRYADSMLALMITGSLESQKDETGAIVIDRDGELFRFVLNFLRNGLLFLPSNFEEHDQLEAEADFYFLTDLKRAVAEARNSRTGAMSTTTSKLQDGHIVHIDIESCYRKCQVYGSQRFYRAFNRRTLRGSIGEVEEVLREAGCVPLCFGHKVVGASQRSTWFFPDHLVDTVRERCGRFDNNTNN